MSDCFAYLLRDEIEPVRVLDQVSLGESNDTARNAHQVKNGEMLTRLGHDRLVGGNDQQRQVNSADTSQHVLDKVLVPGHIHDADVPTTGKRDPGKAQVDRHLSKLLFAEAIRVDAGQCPHQTRLAVIDMAGRAYDEHGLALQPQNLDDLLDKTGEILPGQFNCALGRFPGRLGVTCEGVAQHIKPIPGTLECGG